MVGIKTEITDKYLELDRVQAPDRPFCKDIYLYQIVETYRVLLRYTLQIFDDHREIIGEYVCEAEITGSLAITGVVLEHFMADLAYLGREKFNEEALRCFSRRLYLPQLRSKHIEGLDAA